MLKDTSTYDALPAEPLEATLSMQPKKFALWLFIVSIVMIFASMTSAYIVRRAEGNWLAFDLPPIFWVSTGIILLSSVSMQIAYLAANKNNFKLLKFAILITCLLGIGFLITQYESFKYLNQVQIFFDGNPSGSFLYVLTGLHAFHLITAIIFVFIVAYQVFSGQINAQKTLSISMCNTYWHFLDLLWIYLFIFLQLNH